MARLARVDATAGGSPRRSILPASRRGHPALRDSSQQTYVRRQPEQTVLHRVIREHLESRQRGGGEGCRVSSNGSCASFSPVAWWRAVLN